MPVMRRIGRASRTRRANDSGSKTYALPELGAEGRDSVSAILKQPGCPGTNAAAFGWRVGEGSGMLQSRNSALRTNRDPWA